jgi:cytochrome c oxidase subunit IV
MPHVVPRSTCYLVFAALLMLTALTVGVTYIHMGRFNLVVALLIAITKASLVVLFFMNVKNSSPLTKLFVVAGLFWMGLLILLTFSDYVSRGWLPVPESWSPESKDSRILR